LKQAGIVENIGNIQTLYFGLDNVTNDRLVLLENLFKEAGIEATLSKNISTILWEKFIFISPTATATSYFDKCISEVIADKDMGATILLLIEEVMKIAKAKQIAIPEDITEKTLNKLKGFPFGITSSMHADFQNRKPNNELESLTGYVVSGGKKYEIDTPTYIRFFEELKKKSGLTA
jgi:2-dehydropantoate 2-reductase